VRPPPTVNLVSQKMGIHEWSYDNDISPAARNRVPVATRALGRNPRDAKTTEVRTRLSSCAS